ncbi:MAG: hypothetical protein IJO21_00180 [Oscillospiraceae bacterium]|nr:hypothetical protein [Oscillospiraceae bacterium]MBQ7129450.1 hypothetical protein [Oscillospiraceae bacterium]
MKKPSISRTMVLFFLLALVLIGLGLAGGMQTFGHFEQLAVEHEDHQQLLDSVRVTAFYTMVMGSMVVTGIGILILCLLHLMRRSARIQREAEVLRRRNEAMEELNRKTRQLARHQRLETVGTLTSSIAHEFNNLLTPIMGYSLLALEKLPAEEEELYDNILEIYNASRKAKEIISRLSDLTRKNTDTAFRQVSPDDLIRKTLSVANPAKPRKVEIKLDLNCSDQRIRANEIQLSQLLLNLILNGFQAMENGGSLTVNTSFDETHIRIRVADTGCGIPKELHSKIFEPFFTTKEAGKGTGLGLAIAAQVVEDHGGKIKVESAEGEGTAFTVSLPRNT